MELLKAINYERKIPAMSILSHNEQDKNYLSMTINRFFKDNNISAIMKPSNFYKEKGISCYLILKFLFNLVFSGKNLYRILESQSSNLPFAKDVVYRFINSVHYNWQRFLMLLSSSVINSQIMNLTSDDRVNVLIVDDSLYSRNRSKAVELLARVKDHVSQKYVKGFRLLTLGWSDGNTFIPLAFNLLSSQKESNRLQPMDNSIDKRSVDYKRRLGAMTKETDSMIELLRLAVNSGIQASYVLFDS